MPAPAVDAAAEEGHGQTGHGHADRAGVDGEAHGGRHDADSPRQRRQDGLGREQVDHGQKGGQADHERAQQRAGRCAGFVRGNARYSGMLVMIDPA